MCGFLASLFLSEAIRTGASFTYQSENAFEEWRQVVWGEHWMLRAMTAVLSAAWGGFIAGTVARRRGGLIGLVSSLPFVVLWGAAAYFAWQPDFVSPTAYRFVPFVLMAAIPYITFRAGEGGASVGQSAGMHFDSRPGTLLGVRWYHYIWAPFLLNLVLAQSAWAALYGLPWFKAALRAAFYQSSLLMAIPALFLFPLVGTFVLTFRGLRRAYQLLAGLSTPTGNLGVEVVKFGIGLPLLAGLLQGAISRRSFFHRGPQGCDAEASSMRSMFD